MKYRNNICKTKLPKKGQCHKKNPCVAATWQDLLSRERRDYIAEVPK